MGTSIKTQVKEIFKANLFDTALNLTAPLRDEYIKVCGLKSWNALKAYYKKVNNQPESDIVAEEETSYPDTQVKEEDKKSKIHVGTGICETPLMKQYMEMKKKHPDAILLFRVGDFYETFSEDAIAASEILGITLTRRANGNAANVELAGFPHHALDTYLPRLVSAGRRVAICEQLEDPKKIKVTEKIIPNKDQKDLFEGHPMTVPECLVEDKSDVVDMNEPEIERVEYMLYQNDGEKIDWYGHFVNYKGLKVGDKDMMIRMNNLGIGQGKVLATASFSMEEVAIFHKVYAAIREANKSDNQRVAKFTVAFNNLQEAMKSPEFGTKKKAKDIADFVLNFGANN